MLFYLLVFCGKKIRDCISSLVCVVYIGIYKVGCNIYAKRCLLNGYNPLNLIYQKVSISHNPSYWIYQNVPIDWKNSYWMKMCLLTENVSIEWKSAYWLKICLLKSEKAQLFGVFKCIHVIDLCSHVVQWGVFNKKSNFSLLYYISH